MHPLVVSSLLLLVAADPLPIQKPLREERLRELSDHVRQATVEVAARKLVGTKWLVSHGAGTILDASGLVLTCKHVVREYPTITITTHDGKEHAGKLLYQDEEVDLAILGFESTEIYPTIELARRRKVSPGEFALYAGYPERGQRLLSRGRIMGTSDRVELSTIAMGTKLLRFSGLVETGFSGGPIVSLEGKLLGVVAARGRLDHEIGYAVPANLVLKSLERHLSSVPGDRVSGQDAQELLALRDLIPQTSAPSREQVRPASSTRLVSK
ncbi:MAG: serine protease [Planctomycetota bacterium]